MPRNGRKKAEKEVEFCGSELLAAIDRWEAKKVQPTLLPSFPVNGGHGSSVTLQNVQNGQYLTQQVVGSGNLKAESYSGYTPVYPQLPSLSSGRGGEGQLVSMPTGNTQQFASPPTKNSPIQDIIWWGVAIVGLIAVLVFAIALVARYDMAHTEMDILKTAKLKEQKAACSFSVLSALANSPGKNDHVAHCDKIAAWLAISLRKHAVNSMAGTLLTDTADALIGIGCFLLVSLVILTFVARKWPEKTQQATENIVTAFGNMAIRNAINTQMQQPQPVFYGYPIKPQSTNDV